MPETWKLSTDEQIAKIRANLHSQKVLWGTVEEAFTAGSISRDGHKHASSGGEKGLQEWVVAGVTVQARTKSEARARYKKETGKSVPRTATVWRKEDSPYPS